MERVGTLLAKLQQQFAGKTSADELLLTVQILQAELLHLTACTSSFETKGVAIEIPHNINSSSQNFPEKLKEPDRVVEVLQVDEAEIEAELQQLKQNAERFHKMSANSKPHFVFDMDVEEELPTLAQRGNSESSSSKNSFNALGTTAYWNSTTSQNEEEAEVVETPIRDLKKGINASDRFLYISELFRGDEAMYERSIKTINNFDILPEAEYWIQRELKVKLGWSESNVVVKQFNQLVKRRFS